MGDYANDALRSRRWMTYFRPDPNRKPDKPCPHCDKVCYSYDGLYAHILAKHGTGHQPRKNV